MNEPPQAKDSQVKLRLDRELRDWLAHQAISNRRTVGREIEYRLMQSRNADLEQQKGAKR